jgi:hypothetical protein
MTYPSTQFTITYRTAAMPRPDTVPGYLRRDFNPARLGAWLVWLVMWAMTIEDKVDGLRGAFDSAVFVVVWAVVLLCVGWLQIREVVKY